MTEKILTEVLDTSVKDKKFVSRAGEKLQFALDSFGISVKDLVCADLGCSTGGFTDCLLQNGAKKVYSVDTGYGVLEWKLRNDERVVVMERTNALYVQLPEKVDFISVDVSWTPQRLILPKAFELLKDGGKIISLLKPHYEAERKSIVKGKLKEEFIDETIEKVKRELKEIGIEIKGIIESPIVGEKGRNREFLLEI